jgi:uncharacterized protein with HEPN domain
MISSQAARYLWDVRTAAQNIAEFISGHGFDDYIADKMLRAAVERQFEIIGEALAALRRTSPDIAAIIPELSRIVAFRNVLIHAYSAVDDGLVWKIIENNLPPLRTQIELLLKDAPEP